MGGHTCTHLSLNHLSINWRHCAFLSLNTSMCISLGTRIFSYITTIIKIRLILILFYYLIHSYIHISSVVSIIPFIANFPPGSESNALHLVVTSLLASFSLDLSLSLFLSVFLDLEISEEDRSIIL